MRYHDLVKWGGALWMSYIPILCTNHIVT